MTETVDALVIGAGPAGLMAAEQLALAGHRVTVLEAKPSPARKFLMAGKSGLNLTKNEPATAFRKIFACPPLEPALTAFGPDEVISWARNLGIPVFTGTSGRVFPTGMKTSPLLRAWINRLTAQGVTICTRWQWTGWAADGALAFQTPDGARTLTSRITILALGGASWPRLGSDAAWVPWLQQVGVTVTSFRPANMGLRVNWSPHMTRFAGQPLKNLRLITPTTSERGEAVITQSGLEGGGIYAVSALVRDGAPLSVDLLPDLTANQITARLAAPRPGETLANTLRKALHLDPLKIALLNEFARPLPKGAALARLIKSLPIRYAGPASIDRAISSAGGVTWNAVTEDYELRAKPGTYVCGEMLDWEAPTGGYLLTACLATGRWAGRAAATAAAIPAATSQPPPADHP